MNDHTAHPSICEATGWWAVYKRPNADRYYRVRIAAWSTTHVRDSNSDYMAIKAMVPGDFPELEFAADRGDYVHMWHDGDTYCHCGSDPLDPAERDDIYWCERCVGEIRP